MQVQYVVSEDYITFSAAEWNDVDKTDSWCAERQERLTNMDLSGRTHAM